MQLFGESGNKVGFMNTAPFGVGFAPLVGFPSVNQGLFSTTSLHGTSFQSAKILPGQDQSSSSIFGTSKGGTTNIFPANGNPILSTGPFVLSNHNQQMNNATNLFQWTTNNIVPSQQKPLTVSSLMGGKHNVDFFSVLWK